MGRAADTFEDCFGAWQEEAKAVDPQCISHGLGADGNEAVPDANLMGPDHDFLACYDESRFSLDGLKDTFWKFSEENDIDDSLRAVYGMEGNSFSALFLVDAAWLRRLREKLREPSVRRRLAERGCRLVWTGQRHDGDNSDWMRQAADCILAEQPTQWQQLSELLELVGELAREAVEGLDQATVERMRRVKDACVCNAERHMLRCDALFTFNAFALWATGVQSVLHHAVERTAVEVLDWAAEAAWPGEAVAEGRSDSPHASPLSQLRRLARQLLTIQARVFPQLVARGVFSTSDPSR
eukprot:1338722-Rhodomonas_salina.1